MVVRVLLWINGPFGGGKTQTAYELHRRLPGSVVCDPEHVGFGLHRMLPRALRGDFQDLTAWRHGVREVLDLVLRKHEGPVIAPMTLVHAGYFGEVVGRLREDGHEVRHFALLAERATVCDTSASAEPRAGWGPRRVRGFCDDSSRRAGAQRLVSAGRSIETGWPATSRAAAPVCSPDSS